MKPIRIRPTPSPSHRYTATEIPGPLPPVLYKILSHRYAARFIERGEMMWSSLTHFQNEEDMDRGDYCEGERRYFPITGLSVNRIQRDARPDSATAVLPRHGFVSRAAQSHHIFIYSMTLDSSLQIGVPDRVCVEVFDPARLIHKVQENLRHQDPVRINTFIHGPVRYWSAANPPQEVWALPHELITHKRDVFAAQREYRLAFGIRPHVYDFENVECFILDNNTRWPRLSLDPQAHRRKVRVGSLAECCRIIGSVK